MDGLDFDQMEVSKAIKIFRNGNVSDGKEMAVSVNWTSDAFLAAAGRRLGLALPKRVFALDGSEIDDILNIEEGDTVFISEGEDYARPEGSGACVAGFEVKKLLGKGGFGEVRLGEHIVTKEKVALKFMSKTTFRSAAAAERVVTEIQALTALQHPSVIKMMDVVNQIDFVVLVFEFAAGGDLFDYVSNCKLKRLTELEARSIFRQILSAVAYAHNHNICHGDLKLDNILLANRQVTSKADESSLKTDANASDSHASAHNLEVKVADFGLSVFLDRGEKSKAVGGSTSYMAPEVWNNQDIQAEALDVWCLGCILFAMLCGRLPFDDGNIDEFKIPDDTTMINRVNNLQYSFNNNDVSRAAKDCVARQLVVNMKERTTIATLFNHPWMAHRRDSELDISHILKDNLAGVINNMEHGEASQNGGRRPSMPGDLNLNTTTTTTTTVTNSDGTTETKNINNLNTNINSPTASIFDQSFNSEHTGDGNIFDNMSPISVGSTDGDKLPMIRTGGEFSRRDSDGMSKGLSAAEEARQKVAQITQRSGVKSSSTTGNQDRSKFLRTIKKNNSKGSSTNPGSPMRTPNSASIAGRKSLRKKDSNDAIPMPIAFTQEIKQSQTLTPTPPLGSAKKKRSGGPPKFGRKQTPKGNKAKKKLSTT